jgi:hypothetical protein
METEKVETGVDRLIHTVEKSGKLTIAEIAKKIEVPETTVQLWVDFLVEEKILAIEYKFTTPYVFMNKKKEVSSQEVEDLPGIVYFKQRFYAGARKKKLPEEKIAQLWYEHLSQAIDKQQEYFAREAKKRGILSTNNIFMKYKKNLMSV